MSLKILKSILRPVMKYKRWKARQKKWFILALFLFLFPSCGWALNQQQTIASVISAEACGEGSIGLKAVASTIWNRANHNTNALYSVITAPNQYYGYTAKNRLKRYKECQIESDSIVRSMFEGMFEDITNGAKYFRRADEPLFKWCKQETFRYKNHIFYK